MDFSVMFCGKCGSEQVYRASLVGNEERMKCADCDNGATIPNGFYSGRVYLGVCGPEPDAIIAQAREDAFPLFIVAHLEHEHHLQQARERERES